MIDILLATYNGERYLSEQIDSILNQSYQNWKLLIRDDGSTDKTISIIEQYCTTFPQQIIKINGPSHNIGVISSFELLLKESESDYIMFCDQDDVWLKDKIKISFETLLKKETTYGKTIPLLIHTDLMVVDECLKLINPSFWDYTHLNPNIIELNKYFLAIANCITGCTILMNKAAKNISIPFPDTCLMHDAHIGLKVITNGYILHLSEPTIYYRQHSKNKLGAIKYIPLRKKIGHLCDIIKTNKVRYRAAHPFIFRSIGHYLYQKIKYSLIIHNQIKL